MNDPLVETRLNSNVPNYNQPHPTKPKRYPAILNLLTNTINVSSSHGHHVTRLILEYLRLFFKNELVDGSMVLLTRTSVETKPLKGQLKVPGQRCRLYFNQMSLVVFVQHFWKSQIVYRSYTCLNSTNIKSEQLNINWTKSEKQKIRFICGYQVAQRGLWKWKVWKWLTP